MIDLTVNATPGDWNTACDSYGKVQHSRKYDCVYAVYMGKDGERLQTTAARIESHTDAKLMAASKRMYAALKFMNHVDAGYCICPLNDGLQPDAKHSTSCADSRKALRHAESDHADTESERAQIEWMLATNA